jgi:hypothetical protein
MWQNIARGCQTLIGFVVIPLFSGIKTRKLATLGG